MRPPVTLLTRPPAWLGGGTHLRQMAQVVRTQPHHNDRVIEVGSLRGPDVDMRLPAGVVSALPTPALRGLGAALWRAHPCVHRASLDIPPARNELISILDLAPRHFTDEGALPAALPDQARRARGAIVSTVAIARTSFFTRGQKPRGGASNWE